MTELHLVSLFVRVHKILDFLSAVFGTTQSNQKYIPSSSFRATWDYFFAPKWDSEHSNSLLPFSSGSTYVLSALWLFFWKNQCFQWLEAILRRLRIGFQRAIHAVFLHRRCEVGVMRAWEDWEWEDVFWGRCCLIWCSSGWTKSKDKWFVFWGTST